MGKNLENELREAYFTLWAAVENGIDNDTFFKLRETFRGIQSLIEDDDKLVENCNEELHEWQKEVLDTTVRDGQSTILVLPTGKCRVISKAEMLLTKVRGTNHQEYQLYLDHADDGNGCDITNNRLPLKNYDQWLNS